MTASDTFGEFLREQLAPLGQIAMRRMFGKTGVFCDGVMFGMVAEDTLYLRVDDHNRATFKEAESFRALSYEKKGSTIDLSFWRAPERLLDEPDEVVTWAREALAAARRVARQRERTMARRKSKPQPTQCQMPTARLAQASDLGGLLDLFRASEVSSVAEPPDRAERIWTEMLVREGVAVFVSDAMMRIVATCMLIIAPNLLRAGRGHAFLENVVSHPEFRGQGHGRAVVGAALEMAWAKDCHHILMQSGRADPRVHRFYESCGFIPGVRIGYVAVHPTKS